MLQPTKESNRSCITWCLVIIAAVSVHDSALVVLNDEVIREEEKNPMGRWLIVRAGGNVGPFIAAKLVGTTTVCTIILFLYRSRPRLALIVAQSLAGIQLLLLSYLCLV